MKNLKQNGIMFAAGMGTGALVGTITRSLILKGVKKEDLKLEKENDSYVEAINKVDKQKKNGKIKTAITMAVAGVATALGAGLIFTGVTDNNDEDNDSIVIETDKDKEWNDSWQNEELKDDSLESTDEQEIIEEQEEQAEQEEQNNLEDVENETEQE